MIERIEKFSTEGNSLVFEEPERTLHTGVIEDLSGSNERVAPHISKSARLDQVAKIGCGLLHTGGRFSQASLRDSKERSWRCRQSELHAIDSNGRERRAWIAQIGPVLRVPVSINVGAIADGFRCAGLEGCSPRPLPAASHLA